MKYDYACKTCLNEFEFEVISTGKMTGRRAVKPKKCPNCGETRQSLLIKLIRPTNVIYKGTGFYTTDKK